MNGSNLTAPVSVSSRRAQPYTLLPLNMQTPNYKWLVAGVVLLAGGTQTFAGNSVNLPIPYTPNNFVVTGWANYIQPKR